MFRAKLRLFAVVWILAALVAIGWTPGVLAAESRLDQEATVATGRYFNIKPGIQWAQTFTAGMSGRLDRISLWLDRSSSPAGVPAAVLGLDHTAITGVRSWQRVRNQLDTRRPPVIRR